MTLNILLLLLGFHGALFSPAEQFRIDKDLLLLNYDCKTDVDDLHTMAAFAMLARDEAYGDLKYHAVAGAYGRQEGLYVPPNPLCELIFDDQWTDAHNRIAAAVDEVMEVVQPTLKAGGDVWIAEAGQSDFSAALVKAIQQEWPKINTKKRIHLVQHSDWNEQSATPESLEYVKEHVDYIKIPDGNAVGNGTPGFRDAAFRWKGKLTDPDLVSAWELSTELSDRYNGQEGRYDNDAISSGGLDFSDLSEVCWILGLQIRDTEAFFNQYGK